MQHRVGKHSFVIEDDVVYVKYVAAITLDEMMQMTALSESVLRPAIYLVYDVTEAGMMTPDARRYAAKRSKVLQVLAMLFFGTNTFTRATIALVLATVRLLGREIPQTAYVNSEQEARLWIAAHRQKISVP